MTCGADIDDPLKIACPGSTTRQALPPGQAPDGASKMLPTPAPGTLSELIAATTIPPGAEISGLAAPVWVGPTELKKHVLSTGERSELSREFNVAGIVTS